MVCDAGDEDGLQDGLFTKEPRVRPSPKLSLADGPEGEAASDHQTKKGKANSGRLRAEGVVQLW